MGLINFAKGEGAQAIQLFGRGVRLHGYQRRLKRSNKTENPPQIPKYISYLETLTIFGIKADYMAKFKDYLETEGLPTNENSYIYNLATVNRFDDIKDKNIKVLRVKDGINFKKQAQRFLLDIPDTENKDKIKVTLDCRAKVQNIDSPSFFKFDTSTAVTPLRISNKYLPFLDYDSIYWQLQRYKSEKKYYNISIDKNLLPKIIENLDWSYGIIIPSSELELDTVEKASKATSYISFILQTYMDRFYSFHKNKWEDPYLVYQDIPLNDQYFVDNYSFQYTYTSENSAVNQSNELKNYIDDLSALLIKNKGKLSHEKTLFNDNLVTFDFPHHLYTPLVYKSDKLTTVQVSPVNLNKGEKKFIDMLGLYLTNNASDFSGIDVFLLRNKSKVGMSFFEAGNFYPDFILWVNTKNTQYMTFIDPKGLLHYNIEDQKIQFYKTIKELEKRPQLQKTQGSKNIILNSFILSISDLSIIKALWKTDIDTLSQKHILFLKDEYCIKTMFNKLIGV
jgi:hypothetical protein